MVNTPKIYFDMETHELKTLTEYWIEVKSLHKTFELRRNDRNYQVGDRLLLWNYDSEFGYLDDEPLCRYISYIFEGGKYGLAHGYVILGLKVTPVIS